MSEIEERIQYLNCGDSAIAVQFGEAADIAVNLRVRALDLALKENPIRGITEVIPTYRSEMIHYDPLVIRCSVLVKAIQEMLQEVDWNAIQPSNEVVTVPIWYRCEKTELQAVADYEKITADEVIRIHTSKLHYTFQMGVAPGTVYLSSPTGSFTIPRKATPVPKPYASTIQVWSTHTTISSFFTQSGWNFLGRAPAPSYNPNRPEDPFLIKPGQWVQFREIDRDEFEQIEHDFLENRYERELSIRDFSALPFKM